MKDFCAADEEQERSRALYWYKSTRTAHHAAFEQGSSLATQIGAVLNLDTLRQLAEENRRQSLLVDLGRRALVGEPIIDLMEWVVCQIADVLGVDRCRIIELLPNSKALPRASFGWNAKHMPNNAMPLSHFLLAAHTLHAGQPLVIHNKAHKKGRFGRHETRQTQGIASGVSLIIAGDPQPYGLLSAYSAQHRSFTRADMVFLEAVSDVLAAVIAQRGRQQNLDSIVNLSRILRRATTRIEMMTIILTHIRAVCRSEGAAIILRDSKGQAFVAQGHGIWVTTTGTLLPADSLSWQVMQSSQPFLGDQSDFQRVDATPQLHPVICVALKFNEQPIGVLWVAYPTSISYYDQHLLVGLADVIASAINRSDLHDQTIMLYQEHQQLTKDVQRVERHLASVVESAIDLVLSTDSDGRIITWNRAAERVSGFTRDQMVGQYLHDLCVTSHQTMMVEMIKSVIAGTFSCQAEIPLRNTSGQHVPVSWHLSAIQSDTGESAGIVAVGRDLAEQRHLEAQLFQAAKMASMGVMASGIGHELRNPLGIISANAQLAQECLPDHEIVRTCLQQIYTATKRAALIIDNLLTFARPRSEGSSQIVEINEVLAATFMILDYQIQQRHIELIATLSHTIPNVLGDAALFQQVFINLILNALQAMEGGGTLSVTTQTSDESTVEVIFSDTGDGILPEVLPRIFDPFFTTRPIGQGTGLGLAISYSIIQQHGGSIEVSSSPEKGSTFCIHLPATLAT